MFHKQTSGSGIPRRTHGGAARESRGVESDLGRPGEAPGATAVGDLQDVTRAKLRDERVGGPAGDVGTLLSGVGDQVLDGPDLAVVTAPEGRAALRGEHDVGEHEGAGRDDGHRLPLAGGDVEVLVEEAVVVERDLGAVAVGEGAGGDPGVGQDLAAFGVLDPVAVVGTETDVDVGLGEAGVRQLLLPGSGEYGGGGLLGRVGEDGFVDRGRCGLADRLGQRGSRDEPDAKGKSERGQDGHDTSTHESLLCGCLLVRFGGAITLVMLHVCNNFITFFKFCQDF